VLLRNLVFFPALPSLDAPPLPNIFSRLSPCPFSPGAVFLFRLEAFSYASESPSSTELFPQIGTRCTLPSRLVLFFFFFGSVPPPPNSGIIKPALKVAVFLTESPHFAGYFAFLSGPRFSPPAQNFSIPIPFFGW